MSECLTSDDLAQYHAGSLPAKRVGAVEAHLRDCAECARKSAALHDSEKTLLDDLRELGSSILAEPISEPPPSLDASQPLSPERGDRPARADRGTAAAPEIEGYEIIRELHRGGQGIVYLAIQKTTKRKVAVKVLRDGAFASASAKKRFDREVALVAQLKHPNIITIFDSGLMDNGHRYCVMDYIRGEPLHTHVRELKLSVEETLRLMVDVARGVHYAHQRGIIHRDLKPSNILVDSSTGEGQNGAPRVLDFGLAKSLSGGAETLVSMTGEVFGTLPYMAPEQVRGNPDEIDARTDLYALGIILYELVTGQYPYPVDGQIPEVLQHIAETDPTPPSRAWKIGKGISQRVQQHRRVQVKGCPIDDEVETIILRCLAKEKDRRYASAEALADDLERYLAGDAIQAKRTSRWYVFRKSLPRHKVTAAIGVVVLVAALSTVVVSHQQTRLREQKVAQRESLIAQCQDMMMIMDTARLEQLLERADEVGLAPSDFHTYRGWARTMRLETEGGMADADRAIELAPERALGYYLRASINAYHGKFALAAIDFGKGQEFAGDSGLELGMQGMIKGLLGQYEEGLKDLNALVTQQKGSAAALWIRGFSTWFHLLRQSPPDIDQRWQFAEAALDDLNAAALLYPSTGFIFDVRADLYIRMAMMGSAQGRPRDFDRYMRLRRRDAEHLVDIGAAGNAYRLMAEDAWLAGDVERVLEYADLAYSDLTSARQVYSIHTEDALDGAVMHRVWATWALGDDAGARTLAAQLAEKHPTHAGNFAFGFVETATLDASTPDGASARAEWLADTEPLGAPTNRTNIGWWAGAKFRGDDELAAHIARRLTVGLVDNLRWPGLCMRYLQGRESDAALIRGAGENLQYAHVARSMIFVSADTPQRRNDVYEAMLATGHPDYALTWVQGMVLREKREASAGE